MVPSQLRRSAAWWPPREAAHAWLRCDHALWRGTLAGQQHEQKAPERRGRARVHLSHSRTWQ